MIKFCVNRHTNLCKLDAEVFRLRVMEHDRRRALFRMELVLVAELHPDLAGIEEAEKLVLVLQVRAGGIAEGVAAAAVALLEHLLHVAIVLGGEAELGARPEESRVGEGSVSTGKTRG